MAQGLEAYLAAMQAAVSRQEAEVAAMQASVDEVARVRELVTRLPDKIRHKAMVPYGKLAFFEGELIHTNELLLSLGCDYQLEASAKDAAALLARRQARADAALAAARAQLAELRGRVAEMQLALANEEDEAFMEIRQEYEESEELLRSAAAAKGQDVGAAAAVRAAGAAAGEQGAVEREAVEGKSRGDWAGEGGAAGISSGSSGGSSSTRLDADADARIFARLAELERLEAEAGDEAEPEPSSGSDGDGEGTGDRSITDAGTREGQGKAHAATAEVVEAAPERVGSGAASHAAAQAETATAAAPKKAEDGAGTSRKQPKAAAAPLKKGFLLGGSSAAKKGGTRAAPAAPTGEDKPGPGPSTSGHANKDDVGQDSHAVGSCGARDELARACTSNNGDGASSSSRGGSPTARRRRVSFADGIFPGQEGGEEGAAGSLELGPYDGAGVSAQARQQSGVRSVLKQGSGSREAEQQKFEAPASPSRGVLTTPGGVKVVERVAAMEDGGGAAMAMARAREAAFTGTVRERVAEDAGSALAEGDGVLVGPDGRSGSSAARVNLAEDLAPPKRISKFKQQRMGFA